MDQDSIRQMDAGRGSEWISEGWNLFKQSPGTWIGLVVVWVLLLGLVSSAPLIGPIASNIIGPVFTAGVLLGCLRAERVEAVRVEDLFVAFKTDRLGPLIILGVLSLVFVFGVVMLAAAFGFGAVAALGTGFEGGYEEMGAGVLFGVLLFMLLLLPVMMALWFATPLVMLAGVEPVASLKLSFAACLRNIWPLTLWSLIALLIMIVASLPLFLGLLVAGPVMMASFYRMYRDIFADAPLPEQIPL
ncbi:MAG: hypothetical protein M3O62_11000 [Pseudomonadota bacterium]|nr:hypothetical protein [Pseudomonadota bacterium]